MALENLNVKSGVHTVAKVILLLLDHQEKMHPKDGQKIIEEISQNQQGSQKVIYKNRIFLLQCFITKLL